MKSTLTWRNVGLFSAALVVGFLLADLARTRIDVHAIPQGWRWCIFAVCLLLFAVFAVPVTPANIRVDNVPEYHIKRFGGIAIFAFALWLLLR